MKQARFAKRSRMRRAEHRWTWPPVRRAGDIWGIDYPVPPMRSANWPIRLARRPR